MVSPGERSSLLEVVSRPGGAVRAFLEEAAKANGQDEVRQLLLRRLPRVVDLPASAAGASGERSVAAAMAYKEEGNRLFKESRCAEARDMYTRALLHFPPVSEDNARELSILFANRSAALDGTRNYGGCVQDIDVAFKLGYPKNLQYKIYQRKGHALLKLKQYVSSKENYNKCLDMIGKSDGTSKQRDQVRARTKKHMTVFNVTRKLENLDTPKHPEAEDPKDGCFQFSSDGKVSLNEPVYPRQTLVKERPLATVVLDAEEEQEEAAANGAEEGTVVRAFPLPRFCEHTLKFLVAPVPCSFGSGALFFDEAARDAANASYHAYCWRIYRYMRCVGMTPHLRLAVRLLTAVDPSRLPALAGKEAELQDEATLRLRDSLKWSAEAGEKLVAKSAASKAHLEATVVLLKELLHEVGYTVQNKENGRVDEEALTVCLRKVVLTCYCHAQELRLIRPPSDKEGRRALFDMEAPFPSKAYGLGFFPDLSRFRSGVELSDVDGHCFSFSLGGQMVVKACRPLRPGQLSISLVDATDGGRSSAASARLEQMVTFRCSNLECPTAFPLKENTKEKLIRCPAAKCGRETNIWLKLKRIQELKDTYREARKGYVEASKLAEGMRTLEHLLQEWNKVVVAPYEEITRLERDFRLVTLLFFHERELEWMKTYA